MKLDFPDDDSVLVDGERYVRVGKVSKEYGMSAEHIARLAAAAEIDGVIARVWYIREGSLGQYIEEKLTALRRKEEGETSAQ